MSEPDERPSAPLPPADDWRTTDQDEINRRRARAREESPLVTNRDERHPIFSNFEVHSPSGVTYSVEIRDLRRRLSHCECVDFRVNGLGTCKHLEAVLVYLEHHEAAAFAAGIQNGSPRIDLVRDSTGQTLRVERGVDRLPRPLRRLFDAEGRLLPGYLPEMALESWRAAPPNGDLRVSQEVEPWLECRRRAAEGVTLRRTYEHNVQAGIWPAQETLLPLFPYQREGMLHLACAERALLADEMGLGKTVQAVAAASLLRRLGRVERVLVITPASLQKEWEEQIVRLSRLSHRILTGTRSERSASYEREKAAFFTISTYEAMLTDSLEVNERLRPEVVILDEAQRIKNWNTKTALAVKRLQSRYAWVLTGTPLDHRIDELYSLVSFLDPTIFGPLFRFNREFYEFDERGRPRGYRNLDELRARIRPVLLRRAKADVETELPTLVERTFLIPMHESQWRAYRTHEAVVTRLLASHRRRPLADPQRDRVLREMNALRMICDSAYLQSPDQRTCPKLDELARLLPECMANPEVTVLIFSEWERMLVLVAELCRRLRIEFATCTGSMSAAERRQEAQRFREDPACRVVLCTDSGNAGSHFPGASVVIHCDQPWNPARLEQRVAHARQKDRSRAVTVLHLVSERTIEQRLLELSSREQGSQSDLPEESAVPLRAKLVGGRENTLERLQAVFGVNSRGTGDAPRAPRAGQGRDQSAAVPPSLHGPEQDPSTLFVQEAADSLNGALLSCEERFPSRGSTSVLLVVVENDPERWKPTLRKIAARHLGSEESAPAIQLEIIDRSGAELLRRLGEAGVIHPSLRASKLLYPRPEADSSRALTVLEQKRVRQAREQHARKLRMARLLAGEEMIEEARTAALSAIHELGRAFALEHRQPEPPNALAALSPPLDSYWPGGEAAQVILKTFVTDENAAVQPVLATLGQPTESTFEVARDFFAGIKARLATIDA